MSQAVLPQMLKQGKGNIINIGSTQGRIGTPLIVHYATAKKEK